MIKQIEYENKQAIQNDDSIANKNKVTAEDMNEIKNVVNQNAKELETLQEDNQGNETAIGTLQNDISLIKQNNSEQDKSIQSNTSKIEAINKSIEAINKKNTEQDTNIQKNAKDIETNQNNIKALQVKNAEVKAENERLRSDIESISLVGEAEGESIDLDDSSGARFKKFEIGGNHKQETREGYNILDLSKKPYNEQASSLNGATVTQKNGILTIDATSATNLVTIKSVWTSYTNSTNIKMPKGNYYTPLILNINKAEGGESVGQKTGNITLEEDCVCAQWFYNVKKGQKIELPLFISNNQNKRTYEQYGVMPSLKFSSEIKTVKDNVNEVVCNKNILKILGLGERWEYTEKGIKNLYANPGIKISQLNLKKGQTVEIGFLLLSKVNNDISFVNFVNDKTGAIASFANIQNYNVNTVYKKKYTATDDCTIKTVLYGNVNEEIFEFQLWAEYNQISSTYIKYQEQTITMPVQQEMLQGDYFDFENEKEVHKWNLLSFTGNEAWSLLSGATSVFLLGNVSGQTYGGHNFSMCTHFKYDTRVGGMANLQDETFAMQYEYSALYVKCNKFTTVEEWKAYLKSQYENGTPIKLAYITANITELSFTDEQKVVAKKIKETLHTYKNITHIYSTDETGPIMNVEYAKDLNTTISNIQALVLNNASEEVNG